MRENLNKILHLQSLLKKEHEKCVKMFESNAFVSVEFLFCSSSIMSFQLHKSWIPFVKMLLQLHNSYVL